MLSKYIEMHRIVTIGTPTSPDTLYAETIVDNPYEFVQAIVKNGFYISEILWWERTLQSSSPKLGMGGPVDPRDPLNYYFAETDICMNYNHNTSLEEYIDYLNEIQAKYPNFDLFPSFVVNIPVQTPQENYTKGATNI